MFLPMHTTKVHTAVMAKPIVIHTAQFCYVRRLKKTHTRRKKKIVQDPTFKFSRNSPINMQNNCTLKHVILMAASTNIWRLPSWVRRVWKKRTGRSDALPPQTSRQTDDSQSSTVQNIGILMSHYCDVAHGKSLLKRRHISSRLYGVAILKPLFIPR